MLSEHDLPAQRTLRFLPDPIPNTSPTKHMPARRHTWIAHILQAQRTFPLLSPLNPLHSIRILEMIPRPIQDRRVGGLLDARSAGMVRSGGRLEEQHVFGSVNVRVERHFDSAIEDGTASCCASCVGGHWRRWATKCLVEMQPALHGHL